MNNGNPATLTEQQHRAVATRGVSVVLSSGAGCGKTHVLTERYLSHLLADGAEVGQIVAITFTDRAARQMRRRIRQAVVAHLKSASEANAERWSRHLSGLETAPISTIHSFCGALLRQHAVEAGLDPNFDVLEEVLSANLRSEALSSCLQRLLVAQGPQAEDLKQLILLYGWRAVNESVGELLLESDEKTWQEWRNLSPKHIASVWLNHAQESVLPKHLDWQLASKSAVTRCLDLLRRHQPLPGAMSEPVEIILREAPFLSRAVDRTGAIERLINAAKVGRAGSKAWPDSAVYESIKKAFEDFRESLRALAPERFEADPDDLIPGVEAGQRFLSVAGEVMQSYRERKRQHGVVDFQDLLVKARDLLRDHPEVRGHLQERYRFLLIDELQDTDPVQMELIELLCGGELTTGKLFAVGDHKQSIYRFRGADVSLFQELSRQVPLEGRQGLTVNFRSQPAILDFANALLGEALESYEPLVPHQPQINSGHCIEFLWAPKPDKSSAAEGRAVEAEWIAARIAAMIGRERLVVEEGSATIRPVRAGDVVLLFRAMSNVPIYEAALRRQGLNYHLVGGRAFFAQQEIYDLLNLLRAMENSQDGLSLAGALRSPFCCLSDEALYVLGRHRQGLWAGLFDLHTETLLPAGAVEAVRRARRFLSRWTELKNRLPIARLLAAILGDSGYDAAMQMKYLGERKLANLWKLAEMARNRDRSGLFGLAEFIARLGDLVTSQPREEQAATQPENADVIRLMTIHQAKGLEFPVVFVPDLAAAGGASFHPVAVWSRQMGCVARPPSDEDPPVFPEFAWRILQAMNDLEEWSEDLRTLYVACTRPRDHLVLSAALPADYQPAGPWMLTLARRFDLKTGRCLAEDVPAANRPEARVYDCDHPPPRTSAPPLSAPSRPAPPPLPELSLTRGNETVALRELQQWLSQAGTLFAEAGESNEPGRRERLLRAILSRWDFRDESGWQGPLDRLAARGERPHLEVILRRFAATELRRRLAAARVVRHCVEYLSAAEDENAPGVLGQIDCLWQDDSGRWNLVCWVTEAVSVSAREAYVHEQEPALALAASALREQVGDWPRSVALVFLEDGAVIERQPSRLRCDSRLDEIHAGLREIAARPVRVG